MNKTNEKRKNLPKEHTIVNVNIEDIISNGELFYSDETDRNGNRIGLAVALQNALDYTRGGGYVATLPELMMARYQAKDNSDIHNELFNQEWFATHTEENIGIDARGRFYRANSPVLVIVHGGGILTPRRIRQAYKDGLIGKVAVKYTTEEFENLLEGRLPDGSEIELFSYDKIKKDFSGLPHRYGIVMHYLIAQKTPHMDYNYWDGCGDENYKSDFAFFNNPLALARVGGLETLMHFTEETFSCRHQYKVRTPKVPQGRLLFLSRAKRIYPGMDLNGCCYLNNPGRFIAVKLDI